MFAYHWSPRDRRESIKRRGLLVPKRHPRIITPVTCSEGHRNPHISLGKDPHEAWRLSGGFLQMRVREGLASTPPSSWDLWQVNLTGIKYRALYPGAGELVTRADISRRHLALVAHRDIE